MKLITCYTKAAGLGLVALALGASTLSAVAGNSANAAKAITEVPVVNTAELMADAAGVLQSWQTRINQGGLLPADEAKSWARRNMAKFSKFSPDQVKRAKAATELWEIDLLTQEAQFAPGTNLEFALNATQGETYSLDLTKGRKLGLIGEQRSDLVFTPLAPCRIVDSRTSLGGAGTLLAGATRTHAVSAGTTSYASQGGSATNCGLSGIGGDEGAVLVLSLSTFGQAGPGFVTLFESFTTNPAPNAVSQWYVANTVNTSTVFVTTDCCVTKNFDIFTNTRIDYTMDVIGYFARPLATPLDVVLVETSSSQTSTFDVTSGICPAGYKVTGTGHNWSAGTTDVWFWQVSATDSSLNSVTCRGNVNRGGAASTITCKAICGRIPGR